MCEDKNNGKKTFAPRPSRFSGGKGRQWPHFQAMPASERMQTNDRHYKSFAALIKTEAA